MPLSYISTIHTQVEIRNKGGKKQVTFFQNLKIKN